VKEVKTTLDQLLAESKPKVLAESKPKASS